MPSRNWLLVKTPDKVPSSSPVRHDLALDEFSAQGFTPFASGHVMG